MLGHRCGLHWGMLGHKYGLHSLLSIFSCFTTSLQVEKFKVVDADGFQQAAADVCNRCDSHVAKRFSFAAS